MAEDGAGRQSDWLAVLAMPGDHRPWVSVGLALDAGVRVLGQLHHLAALRLDNIGRNLTLKVPS